MKIKSIFLASLALLLMTGCSKNDENPELQNGSGDLFLKIGNIGTPAGTRMTGPEVTNQETDKAIFRDGMLYFLDNGNRVVISYPILENYTDPSSPDQSEVTVGELKIGKRFTNVPATVTQVYVAANLKDKNVTLPTEANTRLQDIQRNYAFNIGTQQDPSSVTMDGIAPVTTAPANTYNEQQPGDKHALVTIVPIISRIELHSVKAEEAITKFTIRGIYLSGFYLDLPLDMYHHNKTIGSAAKFESSDKIYNTYPTMCDVKDDTTPNIDGIDGLGTWNGGAALTPEQTGAPSDKSIVWAYQVFPGGGCTGCTPRFPSLVIRIDNISAKGYSYNGEKNAKTQYITIKGFLDEKGQRIKQLERGKVYKIREVVFSEKTISDVPDPETINLWVKVEVANWEVIEVTPVI